MLIVLAVTLLIVVYLYIRKKYFTLRPDIPGVSPHFLFGNLLQTGLLFRGVSLPEALSEFQKRLGNIYQFWLGPYRYIVVSDIDDVAHIFAHRNIYEHGKIFVEQVKVIFPDSLLCIIGSRYRCHAAVITPLFRRNKITANLDLIIGCVDEMVMKWRERSENQVNTDIIEQMQNLFLQIFGFIGFDYNFESIDQGTTNSTNELTRALQEITRTFEIVVYLPSWLSSWCLKFSKRYLQAQATVNKYIYLMIEQETRASPESRAVRKRTSLIASLVAAMESDEQMESVKNEDDRTGLSRREVLHEMLLFLMAGSDTTSAAAAWCIHLLSKHPRVQHRIRAELTEKNVTGHFSLEQLDSLVYLDCVIKEVLRCAAPINGSIRTLVSHDRLPKSGIQLYEGDSVYIPFYNLAYDSQHWSADPQQFYPERFLDQDQGYPHYAWIPFGAGHRQCIGQELARFELKVILARLMQQMTFVDAGPKFNAGGHLQKIVVYPKQVGVIFNFA